VLGYRDDLSVSLSVTIGRSRQLNYLFLRPVLVPKAASYF